MNRRNFLKASIVSAVGVTSSCAVNPVTGEQDLAFMSEDEETELGRNLHKQLMGAYKAYNHPRLDQYISEIGEKLGAISHRKELIYHFTLLDTPQVNAFAIPGGYCYVTRGMLAFLGNEAELAGVLGHELGHITARHGVRQHAKQQVSGIVTTILGAVLGNRQLMDLANIAGLALLRGYGRENELEADRVGAEYMANLGYDPNNLLKVIGVLKNQQEFDKILAEEENREPYAYHGLFSTHPDNDKRLQGIISTVRDNNFLKKIDDRKERYFELITGMPVGPGEGEGSARGSSFYHTALDFTIKFPDDWKIENLPDRVISTTKNRETLIELTMRDLNRRISAKELINRLFENEVQDGYKVISPDFEGYSAKVKMNTPFGQSHDCRIFIFYINEKEAFQIVATTKDEDNFNKYESIFKKCAESIRKLKSNEKSLGEPRRIKIHKVKKNETFKSFATDSPYSTHAENRLRVLNNYFPTGEPKLGELIKLIY